MSAVIPATQVPRCKDYTIHESPKPALTTGSAGEHRVNLNILEQEAARFKFDDHSQGILKKMLSYANCNHMKFHDISNLQFDTLTHFISSHEHLFGRPRLSFLSSQGIIIVEWPSAVHEAPINAFHSILNQQIALIPYPQHGLSIMVNQNAAMKPPNSASEFVPDISLSFFSKIRPRLHKYQLILEVAFTQSLADVLQKVKDIVELFPEVVVVLVINISESPYRNPEAEGVAWDTFRKLGRPVDLDTFLAASNGSDVSVGHPVVSGGHAWCSIEQIDYHVWVRDGLSGPKINIDVMEGAHYACGSSPGCTGMDRVEVLLNQDFSLIKDALIAFSQELVTTSRISVDLAALQNHIVSLPSSWNFFLDEFKAAAELTSYERYIDWYQKTFRGTKRQIQEEEEHVPDNGSNASGSSSFPSTSTFATSTTSPRRSRRLRRE